MPATLSRARTRRILEPSDPSPETVRPIRANAPLIPNRPISILNEHSQPPCALPFRHLGPSTPSVCSLSRLRCCFLPLARWSISKTLSNLESHLTEAALSIRPGCLADLCGVKVALTAFTKTTVRYASNSLKMGFPRLVLLDSYLRQRRRCMSQTNFRSHCNAPDIPHRQTAVFQS